MNLSDLSPDEREIIRRMRAESAGPAHPKICASPYMTCGTPVIEGHRLGALDMADRYWHLGEAVEFEILEAYDLTRAELIACLWFAAEHGTRAQRKRWQSWLAQTWAMTTEGIRAGEHRGWWGSWDEIPLPPHRKTPGETAMPTRPMPRGGE